MHSTLIEPDGPLDSWQDQSQIDAQFIWPSPIPIRILDLWKQKARLADHQEKGSSVHHVDRLAYPREPPVSTAGLSSTAIVFMAMMAVGAS